MAKQITEIPLEAIQEEGTPPAPPKTTLKKLIILGGGILFLLAGGVTAAAYFIPEYMPGPLQFFGDPQAKGHQAKKSKPPEEDPGFIYNLDPFIVNLADTDQPRYLKIRINLEGSQKEQNEEFAKRVPQIKDAILSILSKKTFNELIDSPGKEKLKGEILGRLNPLMAGLKFKAVYYTELVIQ